MANCFCLLRLIHVFPRRKEKLYVKCTHHTTSLESSVSLIAWVLKEFVDQFENQAKPVWQSVKVGVTR